MHYSTLHYTHFLQKQRLKYSHDPFIWHEGPRLSTIHAVTTAMGDLEGAEEALSCPTLIQCGLADELLNVREAFLNSFREFFAFSLCGDRDCLFPFLFSFPILVYLL